MLVLRDDHAIANMDIFILFKGLQELHLKCTKIMYYLRWVKRP